MLPALAMAMSTFVDAQEVHAIATGSPLIPWAASIAVRRSASVVERQQQLFLNEPNPHNDNGGWMLADDGWTMCYDVRWVLMDADGRCE